MFSKSQRNPYFGGEVFLTFHNLSTASSSKKRIVSILPSATEIICLLGLEQNLVAISHECDYPESIRGRPRVTKPLLDTLSMDSRSIDEGVLSAVKSGAPLYAIDQDLLERLAPDLVIAQELCHVCATPFDAVSNAVNKLPARPELISLAPHTLENVLEDIRRIGIVTGRTLMASQVIEELERRINLVKERCANSVQRVPSVFCAEWLDPLYNSGHWMPELVEYAGGVEVMGRPGDPSIPVSLDSVIEKDPEVILFAVCGYGVERTLRELPSALKTDTRWDKQLAAFRNGRVYVLDGPSYYNRSGPRLVTGLEILAGLLHPETFEEEQEYKFPARSVYSLKKREYIRGTAQLLFPSMRSQK